MRVFKSSTAREIFRRKPAVKRALWGGEFWTDGYYVATVGEGGSWEVIERYVLNQGKPKDELRQLPSSRIMRGLRAFPTLGREILRRDSLTRSSRAGAQS